MAGLVACGLATVLYTVVNWFLGRIAGVFYRHYIPPLWWKVWVLCIIPIGMGIFVITTTVNQPALPVAHAAACVMATLIGLILALVPARLAAQQPLELFWLIMTGLGLMPTLLLLRATHYPTSHFCY